ncbi:putative transcriptional regulator [Desulforapulum autotrophicum HRM2]|uniref:Transcriptional regulator n=1 Tax=Desulforapulum autotrophicum (strain ATCC 43914 / DSM 3382 / VKM B-1955 / HRM2) TaxID=177437 RepID=C0QGR6_DESAH|nr:putative transcriptional regulator [Desulforapulum autotrophicum HRM2]
MIAHAPVVWAANPVFVLQKHKILALATFEEGCILRNWALEGLERAGIDYKIVYVSRSISGLLDAVKAGFAIHPSSAITFLPI